MKTRAIQKISIRKVGKNVGIVFPEAIVNRYRLTAGTKLFLIPTDHGILILPLNKKLNEWNEAYKRTKKKYHKTQT